jgi:hypothetical protein
MRRGAHIAPRLARRSLPSNASPLSCGKAGRALLPALARALARVCVAVTAFAQLATRTVGIAFEPLPPRVSYSAADFATSTVRTRLSSGLPQTLVVRTYAYATGSSAPLAVSVRSCRVVYDLWEEVYRLDVRTERSDRAIVLRSIDEVVQGCLVVDHVPVGDAAAWSAHRGDHVTFSALVELNPLTPDTVERIRGWLTRPEGSAAPEDAFYGSFVSLFVNRQIGAAEHSIAFHSQDVVVP